MASAEPRILSIISRPFGENTFVAWREGSNECLIVDPGLEPALVIEAVQSHQLTPAVLLITHGHSDHIGGNAALKRKWPECLLVIGAGDAEKLTDPAKNLSAQFGIPITSPPAGRLVDDGDTIEFAGFVLAVREIPGHSIGHVVYITLNLHPPIVFGGDVLFAGSVGRTDLPDGDFEQLAGGIREKLFTLPDETIVLSGHGPATTIGEEKRTNPFVRGG
jgi:glyoxylase-like metal-dependent hydrolase (beta-lactamase superfamily II)